jgi:hypothetical protein
VASTTKPATRASCGKELQQNATTSCKCATRACDHIWCWAMNVCAHDKINEELDELRRALCTRRGRAGQGCTAHLPLAAAAPLKGDFFRLTFSWRH